MPERSQQEKDDIDKVKMPSLDELMREQEENLFESGEDEDEIVDRFMEEKFFSKEQGAGEGGEDEAEQDNAGGGGAEAAEAEVQGTDDKHDNIAQDGAGNDSNSDEL